MYNILEENIFEESELHEEGASYSVSNQEMNQAWQFLAHTGVSVFLTGKAGTGKTTFLRRLREMMPKRMVVLAPTGVAAINAGGQTIHSFFQFPFGPFIPGTTTRDKSTFFKMSQQKKNLIRTLDLLVIDEVSMVRADLLDRIDDAMRRYRNPSLPFGGVQLLLIGDLMQLAPVAKTDEWELLSESYDTPYFYSSHALRNLHYVIVELRHIYRQKSEEFIKLLGHVRTGLVGPEDIERLNSRYIPNFEPNEPGWIRLTTHNRTAREYNEQKMTRLKSVSYQFEAKVKGDFPELSYPTDGSLELKVGAQVMFVKNDPSMARAYYNGKIGVVTNIEADVVEVKCPGDEEPIAVKPLEWENTRYRLDTDSGDIMEETIGTFLQYPLRAAWAITVHKSQGLTFDKAVLDIGQSFAHGQTYVALSRCRSLEGLVLSHPIHHSSVITDARVQSFVDIGRERMVREVEALPVYQRRYFLSLLDELYSFREITIALDGYQRVIDEHLGKAGLKLSDFVRQAKGEFEQDCTRIARAFQGQYYALFAEGNEMSDEQMESFVRRVQDSCVYFGKKLKEFSKKIEERGTIEIGAKRKAEIYKNAFGRLKDGFKYKVSLFGKLEGEVFSVENFLKIKAKILLENGEVKEKPKRRRKKTG